jgi:hypothetical protein
LFVMAIAALAFRGKRCTTALRLPRSDAHRNLAFFLPPFVSALRIPSRVRAKVGTFRGSTGLPRRIHSKYNPYSIFVSGRSSPAQDYTRRCYVSYADFFQWVTLTASRSIAASRARWREQFGRMLIEAFACGVAVAASDSGEMPNVVGEAGVIIPERDEAAWVQAVGNLIDNGSQRAALARSGLERARSTYSWPLIAKQHLEFFDEIVDRQQPT